MQYSYLAVKIKAMINVLASSIIWDPPAWPGFLFYTAASLLFAEVIMLALRCQRGGTSTKEIALTIAAIFAGPFLVIGGLMMMTTTASIGRMRGRSAVIAGIQGTMIAILTLLIMSWPTGGGIITIGAATIFWSIRAFERTTRPISTKRICILLSLRMTGIVLATIWALHPVVDHISKEKTDSVVLIGLDHSKSMNQKDMVYNGNNISRSKAMVIELNHTAPSINHMAKNGIIFHTFSFSNKTLATSIEPDWNKVLSQKMGLATAIGDSSMNAITTDSNEQSALGGILLISDGCNNSTKHLSPKTFARRMALRNVPVYTVGVGKEHPDKSTKAINILQIGSPTKIGVFRRITIIPKINIFGLKEKNIQITCRFGNKIIGKDIISIPSVKHSPELRFEHTPLTPGFHRLTVKAELIDKPENTVISGRQIVSTLVHVTDNNMRILYIEGKPRYESKFIIRAISGDRKYAIHRLNLLSKDEAIAGLPGDSIEDWLKYSAVIIGNVPASRFTDKQLENIKKLVLDYSKGFCMIGGRDSFGDGQWQDTPLNDIMPVDMNKCKGNIDEEINITPTPTGLKSSIMRTSSDDKVLNKTWQGLRSMPGANILAGVKPAATILAETNNKPMIISQRIGKNGRTLAIAFDTTWRWSLSPPPKNKDDVDGDIIQRRFWKQVVEYLAAPKGNFWIHTDEAEYDQRYLIENNRSIQITVGLENSLGIPITDKKPKVTLVEPNGNKTAIMLTLNKGDAHYTSSLSPALAPGTYFLNAQTTLENKTIKATQAFQIKRVDLESINITADHDLLRSMSATSGGKFAKLSNLKNLLADIDRDIEPAITKTHTIEDVFDPWIWPLILTIISLICIEWLLRKDWGLI